MSNRQTVSTVLNAAASHLKDQGSTVTLTTQYLVINDWLCAWTGVATTREDLELLDVLIDANDRLFHALIQEL